MRDSFREPGLARDVAVDYRMGAAPTGVGEPPVVISDLTVAYRDKPVLWDVDLTIPEGRLAAIIGPNGAGKSTLIKAVLDLVPKAAGTVRIFGRPYREQRRLVGYVPQRGSVDWDFPTDALDVVLMGMYGRLGWVARPTRAHREEAMHCLEQVGMADYARRQISQLSGGQQQRVFLARALAQAAQLYLMDEPFVGVDALTERAIVSLLQALRAQGKTVVCVHHDLDSARDYFDWVTLLNVRLIASGPFDTEFTPENLVRTYGGRLHLTANAVARNAIAGSGIDADADGADANGGSGGAFGEARGAA